MAFHLQGRAPAPNRLAEVVSPALVVVVGLLLVPGLLQDLRLQLLAVPTSSR